MTRVPKALSARFGLEAADWVARTQSRCVYRSSPCAGRRRRRGPSPDHCRAGPIPSGLRAASPVTLSAMNAYLLVISDREALGWILTTSRIAFPRAQRAEVAALEPGDELFIYTTRDAFKNPTRDRGRIIGTAQVLERVKQLDEPARFAGRDFPVGCSLKIGDLAPFGEGVELRPLINALAAFEGAGTAWSARLRRPLLRIAESDASLLRQALAPILSPNADINAYTRWYLGRLPT